MNSGGKGGKKMRQSFRQRVVGEEMVVGKDGGVAVIGARSHHSNSKSRKNTSSRKQNPLNVGFKMSKLPKF